MSMLAALQADCKAVISQIRYLTNEELDAILSEDEKIEALLANLDQSYLKDIASEKETLIATNTSLAEFNLNREPEFIEGREKIAHLSTEGEALSDKVREKYEELRSKSGDQSAETTLALLRTAASEMEEESDKTARDFLDEATEIDDFLERFLTARKLMHLRLIKAEKMSKLLTRGGVPSYINAPPVAVNANYFPGIPSTPSNPGAAMPYPTGPLNMPMPGNYYQNHY